MEELSYGYKDALFNMRINQYEMIEVNTNGIDSGICLDFAVVNGWRHNLEIALIEDPIKLFEWHYVNIGNLGPVDFSQVFNNLSNARLLSVIKTKEFKNYSFKRQIPIGETFPYTLYDKGKNKSLLLMTIYYDGIKVKKIDYNDHYKSKEESIYKISKRKVLKESNEFKEKENLEKIVEMISDGIY